MKEETTKTKVLSGLFWKLMENGGVQGVQFLVSIILARILAPEEYGSIALLTIFIMVANVFINQSFSTALIQKLDADEIDFSSVFYLNLAVAVVLYLILFLAAPAIAAFYRISELTPILRVLALVVLFGAVSSVENALVAKRMQFRFLFFSSLTAVVLSGVAGIVSAKAGFGVWALVIQQLSYQFLYMIVLVLTVRWYPKRFFSLERVKTLFSFGWKLLLSSLLDTLYNNLYGLLIGRIYNAETLAFYDKGNQFPQVIVSNINGAIQQVMLPAFSENQQDLPRLKSMVRRSIVTSSYLIFPMMAGLMAVAEPMITLVLTDKWLPCVPFLRMMCISFAFWPIHTANLQAINALGHSEIFLKLEIIKQVLGIVLMLAALPFGLTVMIAMKPVSGFLSTFINAWPNRKLLDYSYGEQWRDVLPSALLAAGMGVAVYLLKFLGLSPMPLLLVQILAGVLIYGTASLLLKLECFEYLKETALGMLHQRKTGGK